ncbi:MAG: T9SS type A sorting domain-containing protein [Bacteroidia bacterium]
MKTLTGLLTFIIFPFIAMQAQEWAPIGAEWYYEIMDVDFSRPAIYGYQHMVSTKDTVVAGDTCRLITRTTYMSDARTLHLDPIIIRQDQRMVYQYFQGDFHLIFDFTAMPGDTLRLRQTYYTSPYPDSMEMIISSVGTQMINGTSFNFQFAGAMGWMDGRLIEKIGFDLYFIPFIEHADGGFRPNGLRCYNEGNFSYKPADIKLCDSFRYDPSGIEESVLSDVTFLINNNSIYLSASNAGLYNCFIYNTDGKLMQQEQVNLLPEATTAIPLKLERPGVYFIALSNREGHTVTRKFLYLRE